MSMWIVLEVFNVSISSICQVVCESSADNALVNLTGNQYFLIWLLSCVYLNWSGSGVFLLISLRITELIISRVVLLDFSCVSVQNPRGIVAIKHNNLISFLLFHFLQLRFKCLFLSCFMSTRSPCFTSLILAFLAASAYCLLLNFISWSLSLVSSSLWVGCDNLGNFVLGYIHTYISFIYPRISM